MSDSFAPTALFLDCNHLYHKLRASDEALACGYCGIAATPRLRVGAGWRRRSVGDGSDKSVGVGDAAMPRAGGWKFLGMS